MGFLRRFLCKIKKVFPLGKVVKIVESNLPEPESVEGFDIRGCKPVVMQESIIRFDVEDENGLAYWLRHWKLKMHIVRLHLKLKLQPMLLMAHRLDSWWIQERLTYL